MENNKRRGAGGITFLMLIVILFGALWFTNQIEQKERELSYSEFRSLVECSGCDGRAEPRCSDRTCRIEQKR